MRKPGAILDGRMGRMIGNGMSLHCLEPVMIFALSFSVRVPEPELLEDEADAAPSSTDSDRHGAVDQSAKRARLHS